MTRDAEHQKYSEIAALVSVTVGREQFRNAEPRFYTAWTHRRHPANGYSIISSVRAISIGGTWSPKRLRGFEIDDQLRPIGHQAAAGDEEAGEVDRGEFVACCKGNE